MKTILAADLFCGAGGASTGLVRACRELGLGYDLLAINHWPIAVDTHSANHPGVRHLCESVERVDPREVVPGGRLHLLLAGPECTHFSTARGGRPVNPQSRASAWHILKWAQELYIDTILIENVPEFRTWGPIGATGHPLKSKKGQTYRAFLEALRSLGYRVEDRILNAADYGDPTTRQRLFIMARRGRHQMAWPMPTHSKTGAPSLFGTTKRWTPARQVIDWSLQGKSIFGRRKPLRPATIARILAGLEKFGGPELKPFLVILRNNQTAQSIDGPVPTLTTSGANVGLAEPFLMPITHGRDANRARGLDDPAPTITGAHRGELALVEPFVLQQQSGGVPRSTDEPLPTIATDGAIAVVEPFLVDAAFGRGDDTRRTRSVDDPVGTLPGSNRFAVAQPFIVPFLGERDGQEPRVKSIDEPLQTVTTRNPIGLAQPFVVSAGGANLRQPRSVEEPLPTVMGSDRLAVAEPYLTKFYGTAKGAQSVDAPLDTLTAKARHALVEPFVVANNTNNVPKSVDEPLGVVTGANRFALVQPVINGYALDIRFRMLQPHELAAAMSFPKSYVFKGNREDTVKQIGNSWAGELSKALCVAAMRDFAPARRSSRRDEAVA